MGGSGRMTFTEDLRIDCAPATVFDLLADARNEELWNEGVSRAELITDEPVGHGSKFITAPARFENQLTSFYDADSAPDRSRA